MVSILLVLLVVLALLVPAVSFRTKETAKHSSKVPHVKALHR